MAAVVYLVVQIVRTSTVFLNVSPLSRLGQLVQVPISTTAAGCWPGSGCHRAAVLLGVSGSSVLRVRHANFLVYAVFRN